ncbi:hexosaminidase D-like [Galleria mellonella]|uniref:beta-N-acetylhexosaminidase n=1 Tax=Galleria mellonella TaxID=7137 RepID=A0A6J3BS12_GALME|nr:hexosaminidase D-like [Galleria mellonella]
MRFVFAKIIFLKVKYIIFTILIVSVFVFYVTFKESFMLNRVTTRTIDISSVTLPNVVVHLDFKGSPLKLEYLESLFPLMKSHGVNGLLLEYEDMFPYEGNLTNISAKNCYKKHEVKKFITNAYNFGFEIIPLIQTFGHLEYVLKLAQFKHLREVQTHPDSICPNKAESFTLIEHMIRQVIEFHTSVVPLKYIHIGCDEVYHINECQQCLKRHLSKIDLFVHHVKTISNIVSSFSKETTVLIWDDMLRQITLKEWYSIDFQSLNDIEIVYWDYEPQVKVSHINLMKYHKKFSNIWIASAFKGADGRTAIIPNEKKRFSNHFSWFNLILDYKFGGESNVYNFKGIILTGWSRYSHMDPPCELLPPSIPSLIINLIFIKKIQEGISYDSANHNMDVIYKNYLSTDIKQSLLCNRVPLFGQNNIEWSSCLFNGVELYSSLKKYISVSTAISNELNNNFFFIKYYSKLKTINMNTVSDNIVWCNDSFYQLLVVENKVSNILEEYYKKEFIVEYVTYLTFDLKKKLHNLMMILNDYKKPRIWERGPIAYNNNNI